ncbi:hypothetical protein [Streptomyces sp. NBC_01236]|nr:hypothetical protein OG324_00075 [Streptomyces sp. NBC_01236]
MPCFLGNADEGKAALPQPAARQLPLGYVVSLWMWGSYAVPKYGLIDAP